VKKCDSGYKTVNYIEFIPILISQIQSMQNEIDELKRERKSLSNDSK
jgi:FtsZ-binding cell division protein ZapB